MSSAKTLCVSLACLLLAAEIGSAQVLEPEFAARVKAPLVNSETERHDCVVLGHFQNVPSGLQIRITLRSSPKDSGKATIEILPIIVEPNNNPGFVSQVGILRDKTNPANGSFLGTVSVQSYDPAKTKYEVKIEFETGSGGKIAVFTEQKSEWISVPAK